MPDSEQGDVKYQLVTPEGILKTSKHHDGQGKATYANEDRDTYDGEFVGGYRCGWGTYIFKKNGDTYTGEYEQNWKNGIGKIIYSSTFDPEEEETDPPKSPRGGFYHGYFTKGLRGSPTPQTPVAGQTMRSEGTFTYCNGDVYVGQWQNGKKHGTGTYACASDKTKLKGEWVEGKMSSGQWIFPNGAFYSGRFKYNKPIGKGVWVFPNGNQLTGEYVQKEIQPDDNDPAANQETPEAPKKDPKVECTFKYADCVCVKGDGPPRQVKYIQRT